MRTRTWSIGSAILAILAFQSGPAFGTQAFTLDSIGTVVPWEGDQARVFGLTFTVTGSSSIFVTEVGVFDAGNDGLASPHDVGIWLGYDLVMSTTVADGQDDETSDNYCFMTVDPVELQPGTYTMAALFPVENPDDYVSVAAVTWDTTGTIIPWSSGAGYSRWHYSPTLIRPTANVVLDQQGMNVNFRFTTELPTPSAEAGPDVDIYSSEQELSDTVIEGTATDPHPGPSDLTYRWLEGTSVLQDWAAVGPDDAANLGLASIATVLAVGDHVLTLEVSDGDFTVSDTMTLTVFNTPPEGQVDPIYQEVEINTEASICGEVGDFDGDSVSYQWCQGSDVLGAGTASPPAGGALVAIPDLAVPALPLGQHVVQLVVDDGVNVESVSTATVVVVDTTAPTLTATSSATMLWPPNHTLRPVTILANAADNGGAVTLDVQITSNEPGDDDWYIESIDDTTGVIELGLRAERTGSGDGRVYTITVTATDASLNESAAVVEVRVPHGRRKKK